jgi:Flp pilus assembly protein TadD
VTNEGVDSRSDGASSNLDNLCLACLLAGKPQKAVPTPVKAASLLPRIGFVHNDLGIACERSGERSEAVASLRAATPPP